MRLNAILLAALLCLPTLAAARTDLAASAYARDPAQPVDAAYTAQIRQATTDARFNTPLTDYLPASATVPTPLAVLGHIAGAPDYLPDSDEVYRYFEALAKASPRVRVFEIGRSEEGRRMIAVAVADAPLLDGLAANDARLAQLADPRRIGLDDARADALIQQTTPVYYITGSIHSTETGAPTALMELAYRLAVDDAPYIRHIRSHVITLITPIVEVDGRDRMADLYRWHKAHPDRPWPPLVYWGHYVAHDNNRDAMAMSLALTRHVADTYLGWHAQVLHDLHESVPFLYDNTVGDGPYNAWIDPILTSEWQQLGWDNVQRLTELGLPGVFTHGDFDTWSPGYLMFIAAMHNGISRLYETFGNGGADTEERVLDPSEYRRTWYRPNPPLPRVLWSQRDNNNYEQAGLLTALDYFSGNTRLFLKNFYLKSKRSVLKPQAAGPAAYVLPGDEPRPGTQAQLLRVLERQHVEISRATAPFTVSLPPAATRKDGDKPGATPTTRRFPAGSYIIRMDQPYSRIADALLDRQYWSPTDPQQHPYDDTAWSMGDLFDVQVVRVTDHAVLQAPMQRLERPVAVPAGLPGIDLPATRLPRIALLHTWLDTQTEGWWRLALDQLGVHYDYISTQDLARLGDLHARFDTILFPPVGGASARRIIDGLPLWGPPLPWQHSAMTPNLGRIDSTPDIRPGMGEAGLAALKRFVADGGQLITAEDTARFAIDTGLAPGVQASASQRPRVVGSVLRTLAVDPHDPLLAAYPPGPLAVYSNDGLAFTVSSLLGGDQGLPRAGEVHRPTGRGGPGEQDAPEGRATEAPPALPEAKPWQALPLTVEQTRNNPLLIPPALRPRVVLRFAAADELLVAGLLRDPDGLAERAAVVSARYGKGEVVLFAGNPIWRGGTLGTYPLVFNAILSHARASR